MESTKIYGPKNEFGQIKMGQQMFSFHKFWVQINWDEQNDQLAGAELYQVHKKLRLIGIWIYICLIWLTNMV